MSCLGSGLWLAGAMALCAAFSAVFAEPSEFAQGPAVTFLEENDLLFRTDRHYTQGLKIAYVGADGTGLPCLRRAIGRIPQLGFDPGATRIGYAIGQNIYTPADTQTAALIPSDRPYAGWLYGSLLIHRRGRVSALCRLQESLELDLGVTGPPSLAQDAQTWIHQVRGFDLPQGWANQLEAEPAFALKYQRTWRIGPGRTEPRWVEVLPHLGTSLGSIETSMRFGASARLGWQLPDDFGPQTIDSLSTAGSGRSRAGAASACGVYVFTAWEGRWIGYTVLLDGNLFHASHHVERYPFVQEWKSGAAVWWRGIELGLATVFRTPDFTGQTDRDRFGALYAKVAF
jgi:hypothetical protein